MAETELGWRSQGECFAPVLALLHVSPFPLMEKSQRERERERGDPLVLCGASRGLLHAVRGFSPKKRMLAQHHKDHIGENRTGEDEDHSLMAMSRCTTEASELGGDTQGEEEEAEPLDDDPLPGRFLPALLGKPSISSTWCSLKGDGEKGHCCRIRSGYEASLNGVHYKAH